MWGEVLKQRAAPGDCSPLSPLSAAPYPRLSPLPWPPDGAAKLRCRRGPEHRGLSPEPARPGPPRPALPAALLENRQGAAASVLPQARGGAGAAGSSRAPVGREEIGANVSGRATRWSCGLAGARCQTAPAQSPALQLGACRFVTASRDHAYDSCVFLRK